MSPSARTDRACERSTNRLRAGRYGPPPRASGPGIGPGMRTSAGSGETDGATVPEGEWCDRRPGRALFTPSDVDSATVDEWSPASHITISRKRVEIRAKRGWNGHTLPNARIRCDPFHTWTVPRELQHSSRRGARRTAWFTDRPVAVKIAVAVLDRRRRGRGGRRHRPPVDEHDRRRTVSPSTTRTSMPITELSERRSTGSRRTKVDIAQYVLNMDRPAKQPERLDNLKTDDAAIDTSFAALHGDRLDVDGSREAGRGPQDVPGRLPHDPRHARKADRTQPGSGYLPLGPLRRGGRHRRRATPPPGAA